ncbi:hypothetical protein AAMO2058_001618700 [Amorphochlora amoebiformis]
MCWERYNVIHSDSTLEDYEEHLRDRIQDPDNSCCGGNSGLWGTVTRASAAGLVFMAHHTKTNDWAVYGEVFTCPTGGVQVEAVVRPRTHVYIFMAIWMLLTLGFCARFRSPVVIIMAIVVIATLAIIIKISQQGVRIYILQPLGIMAGPGSGAGLPLLMNEAKAYRPLNVPGANPGFRA